MENSTGGSISCRKYEVSEQQNLYLLSKEGVKPLMEEFNAEDVKFTFDYTKDHLIIMLQCMVKETRIVDDYTVEVGFQMYMFHL